MEIVAQHLRDKIGGFGITALIAVYALTAMLVKFTNLLFGAILLVVLVALSFPAVRGYTELHIVTTRYPLAFGVGFVGLLGVSVLFWEGGIDYRDPIGVLLFYVLIPLTIFYFSQMKKGVKEYVYRAFKILFYIFFLLAVINIFHEGLSMGYKKFYFHNKNTAGMFFEVIYCYVLFEQRERSPFQTLAIVLMAGITLLAIASKTSIVFCSVFTLGLFSRRLFWLGMIVIGVLGTYVTFTLVDIQGLATAYQRILLWNDAINKMFSSWIKIFFGAGPGTYESSVHKFGLYGKKAIHNYYIQFSYAYGILSFSLLGVYLFHIFRRYGVIKNGATAGFWVFNAHAVFDVGWVAGTGLIASLMLGLILASNFREINKES